MFFSHLLFAVLVAAVLSAIFAYGFRKSGPWFNVFIFFIIVFLASWAGGIWLSPFGPSIWGAHFFSFLIVGLIFALLLTAITPRVPEESTVELVEPQEKKREKRAVLVMLGASFWILLIILIFVIGSHYL